MAGTASTGLTGTIRSKLTLKIGSHTADASKQAKKKEDRYISKHQRDGEFVCLKKRHKQKSQRRELRGFRGYAEARNEGRRFRPWKGGGNCKAPAGVNQQQCRDPRSNMQCTDLGINRKWEARAPLQKYKVSLIHHEKAVLRW
ncbi:hypothetical protein TWF132_005373 [Orbilia oligospora]|nr:hypothetical protein TWF132_005373 [Orbilia oligospora]